MRNTPYPGSDSYTTELQSKPYRLSLGKTNRPNAYLQFSRVNLNMLQQVEASSAAQLGMKPNKGVQASKLWIHKHTSGARAPLRTR